MEEYCTRFIDLPYTVKGVTVQDSNGFYNIYINAHLSKDEQEKAIIHEITHVKRNDFYSKDSIFLIENI